MQVPKRGAPVVERPFITSEDIVQLDNSTNSIRTVNLFVVSPPDE